MKQLINLTYSLQGLSLLTDLSLIHISFRLLGGNILKGAMRIAAYLPKLVGFITGVRCV